LTSVDLLDELRAALDELEPILAERVVDIEMPRIRVLTDGEELRRRLASLIATAVTDAEPTRSITLRVARSGKSAVIEVMTEESTGRSDGVIGSMTATLAPGASHAADA
jgi:signal transduction histidine kinase